MKILIGNTSQLAQYYPNEFVKLSSRNVPNWIFTFSQVKEVHLLFAEQRTYNTQLESSEFTAINVEKTLRLIDSLSHVPKVVVIASADLWNNTNGAFNIDMPFNFRESHYLISKVKLIESIKANFGNVVIKYPVNFNSIYRRNNYFFGKIYSSILNKRTIELKHIDFRRDILHASQLIPFLTSSNGDEILGSGGLTDIKQLITKMYANCNLEMSDYVKTSNEGGVKMREYYSDKGIVSDLVQVEQLYLNDLL